MMDEVDCFSAMHHCLHSFMKKGMFTDIVFLIGESKVEAHKAILASCSQVFQTMFETSMGSPSEVELKDVEEELFSAFLDYLYLRDVTIVERDPQGMLMLAVKYDIESLAALCDSFIESSLTPENAVDTFFFANLYRRDSLKSKVNLYIKQKLNEVSTYASWEKLDESRDVHYDAMNGIFQSFLLNSSENISNKKSNEVTWCADDYYWLTRVSSMVSLVPRGGDTNTVCRVKPVNTGYRLTSCDCAVNAFSIDVELENKLNEMFPCTLVITLSRNTVTISQTTIFLHCISNSTAEAKLFVVYNQIKKLSYPFTVTVAVKKTEPIYQHPYLKIVKEQTVRFSDAVVVVENVKFPVHKLVLAGSSTFFSVLFDKNQNEYRVDGISERTFKMLLAFMYTSSNPGEDQVDLDLLKGAEKFQLNKLASFCTTALQKKITCENAVEMCTKAEELQLYQFSSLVVDFIVKEPKLVANSPKWPTLQNHPRVLKELLNKMNRKRKLTD